MFLTNCNGQGVAVKFIFRVIMTGGIFPVIFNLSDNLVMLGMHK